MKYNPKYSVSFRGTFLEDIWKVKWVKIYLFSPAIRCFKCEKLFRSNAKPGTFSWGFLLKVLDKLPSARKKHFVTVASE